MPPWTTATSSLGAMLLVIPMSAVLAARGRWRSPIAPRSMSASTQTEAGIATTTSNTASQTEAKQPPKDRDLLSPLPAGWTQGWLG